MNDICVRRLAAFVFLAVVALGAYACNTGVGVGYAAPIHGSGWGSKPGGYATGNVYAGSPEWP